MTVFKPSRRELLELAARAPVFVLGARLAEARQSTPERGLDAGAIARAPSSITLADGTTAPPTLRLSRSWDGAFCRTMLTNGGTSPVAVKEATLFALTHDLPATTPLYGEGFQMLSQTGGTVGHIVDLGNYTDVKHYRMPEPAGTRVVYNLLTLATTDAHQVLAFTSCRRFSGQFRLMPGSITVMLDLEGRSINPGETWPLEEVAFLAGRDREALLEELAARLNQHHKPLGFKAPPSGWCSWYCFGPKVTAKQVLDNLDVIARQIPGLRYIQIDDGYQPAMGDWLETGNAFGGQVQTVLRQIRDRGFEPAIWVAPFIAEAESSLFKQHPDWFVKDDDGHPLRADRVTFGGWRRGPWYALDGTHPDAQAHLERVFTTMRNDWGCTYFKLDANFWGAIHGGRFHDMRATRIEAYRRGMAAVLRGTGDAFVLGCNHPIWPSIGLIHGSRSSHDIRRDWKRFTDTARQNLSRNWQNGRLWWNDPDAIVLTGELSEEEYRFHATVIYASGGMILSGDDLTTITPARLAMLRKLQPPTAKAARYDDVSMQVGEVELDRDGRAMVLLNWDDQPRTLSFTLPRRSRVRELWTDEDLGDRTGSIAIAMPPRSGRVFVCSS
ncbi:MAG TPA: glycoside hydrolase family 36 protein [Vicinamibacterales bacterium]|nr:glycoside hydrolase family 36 protein [Vicinamibacterales bacterium]